MFAVPDILKKFVNKNWEKLCAQRVTVICFMKCHSFPFLIMIWCQPGPPPSSILALASSSYPASDMTDNRMNFDMKFRTHESPSQNSWWVIYPIQFSITGNHSEDHFTSSAEDDLNSLKVGVKKWRNSNDNGKVTSVVSVNGKIISGRIIIHIILENGDVYWTPLIVTCPPFPS